MAWGWETANICQSKLSWVLLGFGEWKADKASPHTLGCTRQEESREDGTGGAGGLRGGLLRFPPAPRGYVHHSYWFQGVRLVSFFFSTIFPLWHFGNCLLGGV